jgi:hypothetical protein
MLGGGTEVDFDDLRMRAIIRSRGSPDDPAQHRTLISHTLCTITQHQNPISDQAEMIAAY